eukprot:TRINITY_DN1871_c0_g1_i3.p1 TRINITY_DN1871_c0_g1~~TRINITY_DN1871_c0_g1_i3.p1  ORF type:complete len:103 (+),score=7.66 TRINITY_DN1871_c0_g1_i3:70-378(+)
MAMKSFSAAKIISRKIRPPSNHTNHEATPIMAYKDVQTIGKTQPGGVHGGFLSCLYQSLFASDEEEAENKTAKLGRANAKTRARRFSVFISKRYLDSCFGRT